MQKHERAAVDAAQQAAEAVGLRLGAVRYDRRSHLRIELTTPDGRSVGEVSVSSSPRTGSVEAANYARQATRRLHARLNQRGFR